MKFERFNAWRTSAAPETPSAANDNLMEGEENLDRAKVLEFVREAVEDMARADGLDESDPEVFGHMRDFVTGAAAYATPDTDKVVGQTVFRMPVGANLARSEDGAYTLLRGGKEVASGITIDAEGQPTPASTIELAKRGIIVAPTKRPLPSFTFHMPLDAELDPPIAQPVLSETIAEPLVPEAVIPVPAADVEEPEEDLDSIYQRARSPELSSDPDYQPDHFEEIERHLSMLEASYRQGVMEAAEEMGQMSDGCRATICIPAAGHQEGKNIFTTLENYTHQSADPTTYEIAVFVNRPETDREGRPIQADETRSEIERFQREYPHMQVRVMDHVLPLEKANIGYIRRFLGDVILARQHARGPDAPDLIMINNDADNKGVAPAYVENFLHKFDANPGVDAMLGQIDWDPAAYVRNPLVHVGTRLFLYIDSLNRRWNGRIGSSGANFAIRSSMYAAVGGYREGLKVAEDVDLGRKLRFARAGAEHHTPIAFAGVNASRIYTSARRAEHVLLREGRAPVEQWDKGFSAFDDEVRKVNWEDTGKPINFKDPEEVRKFVDAVETIINRTVVASGLDAERPAHDARLATALDWLGVSFEFTGDSTIRITDPGRMLRGLERYQKRGLDLLLMKSGKRPYPHARGDVLAERRSRRARRNARRRSRSAAKNAVRRAA